MRRVLAIATSVILAGCTQTIGDFCDVAAAIRPSVDDAVTPGTQTQILKHNNYGAKNCGWK